MRCLEIIIGAVARIPAAIVIERAQFMCWIMQTDRPVAGVFTGGVFVDVVAEE